MIVIVAVLAVAVGVVQTVREPGHLYAKTGEFAACPARPSCVSSVAEGEVHRITPLTLSAKQSAPMETLSAALQAMGGEIRNESEGYLHAVFVTPLMRYHDDVEVLLGEAGRVDVRSISRFGYNDFGVNRQRVEDLRLQLQSP